MRNRDLFYVLLCATLFFALLSILLQLPANATTPLFLGNDPASYWEAAKLIYTEGGKPHPLRSFLYPFLIGLPSIFGDGKIFNLNWALSLNFVFWLATVGFIYEMVKETTHRKIAFIAALVFVSNTSNIINCWLVLAESLFHFLMVGSAYFLMKYLKNRAQSAYYIGFIAFFTLSLITRPTYSPLMYGLLPLFTWVAYKRYLSPVLLATSVAFLVSTVGFTMYKMHQTYGDWELSYLGECTFYAFSGAYAKSANFDKSIEQMNMEWHLEFNKRKSKLARYNDSIPWSSVNNLVKTDMREQLSTNKTGLMVAFLRDLVTNSTSSHGEVYYLKDFEQHAYFTVLKKSVFWWSRWQNILNTFATFIFIPIGFYRLRRYFWHQKRAIFWILFINSALGIVTMFISSVSFSQGDRFHLVTLPLSLVSLAIIGFYRDFWD
jgi:hypothetical protein